MVRSHFTLAALATTAVDGLQVVGSGPLSNGASGNFDSALLQIADGTEVCIRVPTTEQAATEQSIEVLALGSLTAGTRSLLPFDVPRVLGQAATRHGRAVVYDYLPGFSIGADEIPAGDGLASSIGAAIAAIHALPGSFLSDVGLPVLNAVESRNEARNVIDRAVSTKSVPAAVQERWREAVEDDEMWQFHPTVVNGSLGADSFVLANHEIGTLVSSVIGWGSLRVADPARDLSWLAGAGQAAGSIFASYEQHSARTPDGAFRRRALLHAELELARWLLHGRDVHDSDIVHDAIAMLDGLVDTVLAQRVESLAANDERVLAVDDVEHLLARTPATPEPVDRNFDTSAFEEWDDETNVVEADRSGAASASSGTESATSGIERVTPDTEFVAVGDDSVSPRPATEATIWSDSDESNETTSSRNSQV